MYYSADNTYDNLVLDSELPVLLWAIIHIPQQNFFICIVNVKIQTKLCNCVMSIDVGFMLGLGSGWTESQSTLALPVLTLTDLPTLTHSE